MRDDKTTIASLILLLAFLSILFIFRKLVRYPFCSLEEYSGTIGRAKSVYFLLFHLVSSLGLGLVCFFFLTNNERLNYLFDNTIFRLGTITLIWMVWALGIGWLIELYLEYTDKKYKLWKIKQQNKR